MNGTRSSLELASISERRDSVKVIVDMLTVALGGTKKTEMVYKANLNFKQAQKYLEFLLTKGLMVVESSSSGRKVYWATDRGRSFIKRYEEIVELLL